MIVGVGIDVVDVSRFAATLERTPALRERLFTASERSLPINSLAARFAAKEALAKSLGAPVGLHWTDAWIVTDTSGRPHLQVDGTVAARVAELDVTSLHVSLSHDAGIASAVVIAESLAVPVARPLVVADPVAPNAPPDPAGPSRTAGSS